MVFTKKRAGFYEYANLGYEVEHMPSGLWQLRLLGAVLFHADTLKKCRAYANKVRKVGLMNLR